MRQTPKNIFTVFIIAKTFIIPGMVTAQYRDSVANNQYKEIYIDKMSDRVSIKLSVNDNLKGFSVRSATDYDLLPNDKHVLKLSFNYRWLSFSISNSPRFISGNDDDLMKGKTTSMSYSLGLNFNHWMQSIGVERVKGFYLNNTKNFVTNWQPGIDPYIQFPDLVFNSLYGTTGYKFNQRFSFNALETQTERQLKSAGTFIPFLSYNYYIVNDKTPLNSQNSSQKSKNLELILSVGYTYTFVIAKKFYVNIGTQAGSGLINTTLLTRWQTETYKSHYTNAVYRAGGQVAAGYNSKKMFAGLRADISAVYYKQRNASHAIISDKASYQLVAGYRFSAPCFLKKWMDKADEKKNNVLNQNL